MRKYARCAGYPWNYSWLLLILCQALPENYAPLLAENIKKEGFTHVFAGHSAFGKNLMPRVSALLDVQQISDITAIEGEDSKNDQATSAKHDLTHLQLSSGPYTLEMPSSQFNRPTGSK